MSRREFALSIAIALCVHNQLECWICCCTNCQQLASREYSYWPIHCGFVVNIAGPKYLSIPLPIPFHFTSHELFSRPHGVKKKSRNVKFTSSYFFSAPVTTAQLVVLVVMWKWPHDLENRWECIESSVVEDWQVAVIQFGAWMGGRGQTPRLKT